MVPYPPTHGSADLKLVDFNGDGFDDLVTATGDNGDFIGACPLKPYQGIRICLNNGENQFREAYFFPMYGAYGVEVEDFDQDGDLDLAAISFFADYRVPGDRSFVYLENLGEMTFLASTFKDSARGRWLRMAAGDYDGDGDKDLLIGSFTPGPSDVSAALKTLWKSNGPSFLILRNRFK